MARELTIYEQLDSVATALTSLQATLSKDAAQELEISIAKLKGALVLFDSSALLPAVAGELDIYAARGSVEKLGLSKEVLALASNKLGATEISQRFKERGISINASTIRAFIEKYQSSSYGERVKVRTTSVFDTSTQLEKLLAQINSQLGRLQYSTDPKQQENHSKYISELRQTIKLAADLQIKLGELFERRRFQEAVKQVILSVCTPDQQQEVLRLLKDFGDPTAVAVKALSAFDSREFTE